MKNSNVIMNDGLYDGKRYWWICFLQTHSFFILQMITDGLWIIVMFLSDSHSDGTHSLQSIHCWDTDAETHFSKPDEETNSSTSRMAWGWVYFWINYSFKSIFLTFSVSQSCSSPDSLIRSVFVKWKETLYFAVAQE